MAKDPTPRADALREQREARYGHLQAKAEPPKPRKLIPYAGQPKHGGENRAHHRPVDKSPEAVAARKAIAAKRKPRKKKEKTT